MAASRQDEHGHRLSIFGHDVDTEQRPTSPRIGHAKEPLIVLAFSGATRRIRTDDLLITNLKVQSAAISSVTL